jgi:hypothetical protein
MEAEKSGQIQSIFMIRNNRERPDDFRFQLSAVSGFRIETAKKQPNLSRDLVIIIEVNFL